MDDYNSKAAARRAELCANPKLAKTSFKAPAASVNMSDDFVLNVNALTGELWPNISSYEVLEYSNVDNKKQLLQRCWTQRQEVWQNIPLDGTQLTRTQNAATTA